MQISWRFLPVFLSLLTAGSTRAAPPAAVEAPLRVVAAENTWGDIAAQVGGKAVTVSSIVSAPDVDPHLFEPVPTTARDVADAAIVILNGAGYDPWMDRLAGGKTRSSHHFGTLIRVSDLVGWREGENEHLWFSLTAVEHFARAFAAALPTTDQSGTQTRLASFEADLSRLRARIAALRARVAGMKIAATEPLLGDMTDALGLVSTDDAFQLAIMNETEPGPAEVARLESDLKNHRVRLLIYNSQTVTPATVRLLGIARAAGVPSVAAAETLPAGLRWQDWMNVILDRMETALTKDGRP